MHSRFATAGICVLMGLSGCGGGGGKGGGDAGGRQPGSGNAPPTIAGAPLLTVLDGEFYEFRPVAEDPDGDRLQFSIAGKPDWARFDRDSGRLWGTPAARDAGIYEGVRITVSDGRASAALAGFDLTVVQVGPGAAVLSWHPPTENSDGSVLTDLAGYRIYYGRNKNRLEQVVHLDNPGLTRYVLENLTAKRWYFSMTSLNTSGVESARSRVVHKKVS